MATGPTMLAPRLSRVLDDRASIQGERGRGAVGPPCSQRLAGRCMWVRQAEPGGAAAVSRNAELCGLGCWCYAGLIAQHRGTEPLQACLSSCRVLNGTLGSD